MPPRDLRKKVKKFFSGSSSAEPPKEILRVPTPGPQEIPRVPTPGTQEIPRVPAPGPQETLRVPVPGPQEILRVPTPGPQEKNGLFFLYEGKTAIAE